MVDRLAALLDHFAVSARTFHAGALCGINTLDASEPFGQLHLVRHGQVEVRHGARKAVHITRPSLLLYPRPMAHRFITDRQRGADFVCAHVQWEGGTAHPIAAALPPFVCLPLEQLQSCELVLQLLFAEAEAKHCGRQAMLNRLFEVVLIQILRELMQQGQVQAGMLAGLAHERLRRALVAMHESPQRDWSLAELAGEAGMSRTVFANAFRDTLGCTPGNYLQCWRIGLAQKRLRQGQSLKLIAAEVGYGSEAALSRAFRAQTGMGPRDWRKMEAAASPARG
ncbi:AraC family transcriptional regulator [Aquabacterium sp. A7-Y]|uniref:AraC family transcriptional regulator n=1 Tax=Aquabacterium sp. A7-Y TaxID=1349605 RepID=UPI00223D0C7C|nr:AraC family transcriptional regulator [Aquabacterium sp. A7-Y]MCW7540906.1 AraC family transcriptional regulator [Aquabacterium sp. A7-Y]